MFRKGFTLIELLIVIAIIGLIAVAVLSAINPLEQFKKGNDTRRKSDAAELLNAYERYYATFGCYPWELSGTTCTASAISATNPSFSSGGNSLDLITKEELKSQYSGRVSVTKTEMFVTKASNGQLSVCFTPESQSGRSGGQLGPLKNQTNSATGSCGATYSASDASCNVCLPQ
jgi:prepilin-type N-terminal cleavage/methylation domain-containing protein